MRDSPSQRYCSTRLISVSLELYVLLIRHQRRSPSDAGLKQAGLPESIASVIRSMPVEHQGMYWGHVGLFGGVAGTEAIGERL